MKVLFISSDNKNTSGAFLCMTELCKKLRDNYNVEPFVILPFPGSGQNVLEENNIPYKVIFSFTWLVVKSQKNTLFQKIKRIIAKTYNHIAIYQIRKVIRKEKIEIVHINTTCTYVGAKAAKKENKLLVWHLREFLEEHSDLTLWNRPVNNQLIASAERVVTISNCLKKKYEKIVPVNQLKMIYDGIDTTQYEGTHNIFQNEIPRFIFVGALYKDKGIEDLLHACAIIKNQNKPFSLWIAGQGEEDYTEYLKSMVIEFGIEQEVDFLGVRRDVNPLMSQSDIAFMCSKAEAFGRVTVEGMMAGCLVIGSNTAATAELVTHEDTGLLYSYGDVNELANRIEYALNNKEIARKIACAGQKYANENFSLDRTILSVYQLYQEMLEEKNVGDV